jgi:hypothetical protein
MDVTFKEFELFYGEKTDLSSLLTLTLLAQARLVERGE